MKNLIISTLLLFELGFVFGQSNASVSGQLVEFKAQNPLQSVVVTIPNTTIMQLSDANGNFLLENVKAGKQYILFRSQGYKEQLLQIEVLDGQQLNLGIISLETDISTEQQATLITITDTDLNDDNSGSESTAGLLQSTKDVFLQVAAYNFGQARFSVRGIDNEYSSILINGILMNRISDGRPQPAGPLDGRPCVPHGRCGPGSNDVVPVIPPPAPREET